MRLWKRLFQVSFYTIVILMNSTWAENNANQNAFQQKKIQSLLSESAYIASQEDFDVIHYQLDLEILPESEWVDGVLKMTAVCRIDGLDNLALNFTSFLSIASVGDSGISYTRNNELLTIQLNRGYNEGERFTVSVEYSGQPTLALNPGGLFFARRGSSWAVHSESCPWHSRNWFPCKDVPWDKADSADMIITMPEDLVVASNGVMRSVMENGDGTKTYHWHEGYPIATYLISIQITNYDVFQEWYVNASGDSMPLIHFAYPEDVEKAQVDWGRTADMMRFFEGLFGEYPFFDEKYGMVEYNAIWGGMENQTLTSIYDGSITGRGSQDDLVAHELSHQWWGDCITMSDWGHTWLNEGFATYCESLWLEHVYGDSGYWADMENNLHQSLFFTEPIYRKAGSDVYDWIVYQKGACILHMLRHILGDEDFFNMFPKYLQRFAYSNASTEDLQAVCEEIYGDYLDWFFEPWIYGPGYPHYAYVWESEDLGDGRFAIRGFINQIQTDASFFTMPLDITILAGEIDTTFVLFVDEQGDAFECILTAPPDTVLLDRDHWILRDISLLDEHHAIDLYDFEIDDSSGDGDGRADPSETVNLVVGIKNVGTDIQNIRATLSCQDQSITVLSDHAEYGDLGIAEHLTPARNVNSPFQFKVASNAESHLAAFLIHMVADGGYSKTDSFFVKIGPTHIVLVDDSGRRGYSSTYQGIAESGYINMDILPSTLDISWKDTLVYYDIVMWCTGDLRENVLNATEQAEIESFLKNGGKLFISGQDIGYDLNHSGSVKDTTFFAEVFHAKFIADEVKTVSVRGESGDPIGDGQRLSLQGRYGAENQSRPDAIEPTQDAYPILRYLPMREVAGIRYENGETRLVYLGFGIEGISGPKHNTAAQFLQKVIDWLFGMTTELNFPFEKIVDPQQFELYQNHPNPFNAETIITYSLPESGRVKLDICNVLGQHVRTLVDKVQCAGIHSPKWDGCNDHGVRVTAGVYSYRLIMKDTERVMKLLFIP